MVRSSAIAVAIVAPPVLPAVESAPAAATAVAGVTVPVPITPVCAPASAALCEACNGLAIALMMQSLWACVMFCVVSRSLSMRRASACASLMLFLYATTVVRVTVVACCFYSSESVALDITWCAPEESNASAWAKNCGDTSSPLRLFFGTSVAIQTGLCVGLGWCAHHWNCPRRCRQWWRGDADRRGQGTVTSVVVRNALHDRV